MMCLSFIIFQVVIYCYRFAKIEFLETDSIGAVKEKVGRISGIPVDAMEMELSGNTLQVLSDDDKLIFEYGITSQSRIAFRKVRALTLYKLVKTQSQREWVVFLKIKKIVLQEILGLAKNKFGIYHRTGLESRMLSTSCL